MSAYRDELDRVRMSEEGKRSLAGRLAAGEQTAAPMPRRVVRTSLAAAAIVCLLLAAAGAAVLMATGLQSYLGGGKAYADNVQNLNVSRTVDGYTITLTDCVGDDHFLYIGMELAGPEGTALDPGLVPDWCRGEFSGLKTGGASSIIQLPDSDPADNKRQYICWHYTEKPVSGCDLTLKIGGLSHKKPGAAGAWSDVREIDAEGPWTFGPIRLDYPERAVDLEPNVPVPLAGGESIVTAVKITPLSAEVSISGESLAAIHTTGVEKDGCWGVCRKGVTIKLYGKDGNPLEIPGLYQKACPTWEKEGRLKALFEFKQLIELDGLGAIEVCGVMIPVAQ